MSKADKHMQKQSFCTLSLNLWDVFFIPIKVNVCLECGERYYDRKAMKYLEKLEEELAAKSANFQAVGKVYKQDMKLINP